MRTLGCPPRGVPLLDGLLAPNVASTRPFGRRLFIERDALAFIQLVKTTLNRASVKEPLLPAVVANEPETSVPDKSLDTAARHPSLLGLSRMPEDTNIKFRSTELIGKFREF
jgi:hypothetical protein